MYFFRTAPFSAPCPASWRKKGHKVGEMAGLAGKRAGGLGALIGEIGVALRHCVHIGDGAVDLLEADRPLPGGVDDADGPVGDDRDRRSDLVQGTPGEVQSDPRVIEAYIGTGDEEEAEEVEKELDELDQRFPAEHPEDAKRTTDYPHDSRGATEGEGGRQ